MTARALRSTMLLAAILASICEPAVAQAVLPPHAVTEAGPSGCVVDLLPNAVYGSSLRLTIRSLGVDSDQIGIALTSDTALANPEFVFRNRRSAFEAMSLQPASSFARSELWRILEQAAASDEPLFITARTSDGDWASARYEGISPRQIIQLLELNRCYSAIEVTAESPVGPIERERALGLSRNQITHIRWVLAKRNNVTTPPNIRARILDGNDRRRLLLFSRDAGVGRTRYLNAELARLLLAIPIRPSRPTLSSLGPTRRQFEEWNSYITEAGSCEISTIATSVDGPQPYIMPRMRFAAVEGESGALMYFDLVHPRPFRESSAAWAYVGGRRYELQIRDGRILPRSAGGNTVTDELTRAMGSGSTISISGTDYRTGDKMIVIFSAIGFSDAFYSMMGRCNRWGLRTWLD